MSALQDLTQPTSNFFLVNFPFLKSMVPGLPGFVNLPGLPISTCFFLLLSVGLSVTLCREHPSPCSSPGKILSSTASCHHFQGIVWEAFSDLSWAEFLS